MKQYYFEYSLPSLDGLRFQAMNRTALINGLIDKINSMEGKVLNVSVCKDDSYDNYIYSFLFELPKDDFDVTILLAVARIIIGDLGL